MNACYRYMRMVIYLVTAASVITDKTVTTTADKVKNFML